MTGGPLFPRRLVAAVLVAAAPTLIAFALLAAAGATPWAAAASAALGVLVILALLLRPHLRRLQDLARHLRTLGGPEGSVASMPSPPPTPWLVPELGPAAAAALRGWSERRRILEASAEANERILASLPDPLILLGDDRRIRRANPAAEALLGGSLAGRDLTAVLRNPELIEAVDATLAGGPGRVVEFALPVPVERSLSARVQRLPDRAAEGIAALLTLHDLTTIKRADQMRADFVANVSHELRTPLSTLIGFIETLGGPARDDPEAQIRFLAIMHEQAQRMARLVADLLSLSGIELNEHSAPTGAVDLARTLRSVIDTLQFKAAEKGMTIAPGRDLPGSAPGGGRRSIDPAAAPPVTGDADEIAQVFQNLIDNSIKYGRPGSIIRIALWRTGPGTGGDGAAPPAAMRRGQAAVAIAVSDESEGIAREHLPRLTERFYRVDTARSRDLGGTGLGLAIVKHIVNRHRGALEIDSEPGIGSTFTVHLPVAGPSGPEL